MAKETNVDLRNEVMYSIYVRNHSEEGTFNGVEKDLDRIKDLGTDIIWFMPIHPIGKKNKKGELGCPYAIQNYREINPEYGTLDEFKKLVNSIHAKGMKCIIDVVYNHTSPDSWLVENKPEYFYRKADGNMGNKVGEWWDVVDLDYSNKELWDYQIETLKMWAQIVDGFRCDVASMVPVDFWIRARKEVAEVNKNCLWLAESIDRNFIKFIRESGFEACSDSEVYRAFDICYDYDVKGFFDGYLKGDISLNYYVDMLNLQETTYPKNYVKLRFIENHDNPRAKHIIPDEIQLLNWTAFEYFQKGTTLIYAGQEVEEDKCPSLFDYDKVNWNTGKNITSVMQKLYKIKKDTLFRDGNYRLVSNEECQTIIGYYEKDESKLVGLFSLKGKFGKVNVELNDGSYINILDGQNVEVKNGVVETIGNPIIIKVM